MSTAERPEHAAQQPQGSQIDRITEQLDHVHELLEEFLSGRSAGAAADPNVHTLSEAITTRIGELRERILSLRPPA